MNAQPIQVIAVKVAMRIASCVPIPACGSTSSSDYEKRNSSTYLAEDEHTKTLEKGNVYSIGNDETPSNGNHYILTFFCTG